MSIREWIAPSRTVEAHCDLPCGIYDPEQARIEAESCLKIIQKYTDSQDPVFKQRALVIKEHRAQLAKEHIDVLWSDYYKPAKHDGQFSKIKDVFKEAVTQCSKVKASVDAKDAEKLLDLIDQIDEFWQKSNGPAETRVKGRPAVASAR